jgi:predicted ABC-type ATPase
VTGDPVLHLLAGPNGSGKSTLHELVLAPVLHLEFVNADEIARARWPDAAEARSYEAAALAEARRQELLAARASFVTETVFSHESKLALVDHAVAAGYLVTLHMLLVPLDLSVARVEDRAAAGGHSVPDAKIRQRYHRLWPLVAGAISRVEQAVVYDNSRRDPPFRVVGRFYKGVPPEAVSWPTWTPRELLDLSRRS